MTRLGRPHQAAVRELLILNPEVNLFLLGFLELHALERACWFAVMEDDKPRGVVLLVPGRLAVPWCPVAEDAADIGRFIRPRYRPCMVVGPRAASDALWRTWAWDERPDRHYEQRLYVCDDATGMEAVPGFRLATLAEAAEIARNSGEMEGEDLGRNPHLDDPELQLRVVRDRITAGRTWVIGREGQLVFQINVGTQTHNGCQVGGTWVPASIRGQGIATLGMRALCRELLHDHPRITLHVNEANLAAVRVYEKSGFRKAAPFRLITVR